MDVVLHDIVGKVWWEEYKKIGECGRSVGGVWEAVMAVFGLAKEW